jgi:hypothetical protein
LIPPTPLARPLSPIALLTARYICDILRHTTNYYTGADHGSEIEEMDHAQG